MFSSLSFLLKMREKDEEEVKRDEFSFGISGNTSCWGQYVWPCLSAAKISLFIWETGSPYPVIETNQINAQTTTTNVIAIYGPFIDFKGICLAIVRTFNRITSLAQDVEFYSEQQRQWNQMKFLSFLMIVHEILSAPPCCVILAASQELKMKSNENDRRKKKQRDNQSREK